MRQIMLALVFGLTLVCTSNEARALEITSFSSSVSTKGAFQATVQFDGTDGDCTVVLRGGTSSTNAVSGSALTSMAVISPSINWQRTLKRTAKANGYIVAQLVCGGSLAASNVVKLSLKRVKSTKNTVSVTKWFQLLSHQLAN